MIPRARLCGVRWKTSGKKRFQSIRQRANEQHVDYLRQLGAPPPRDPRMQRAEDRARWQFDFAHLDRSELSQKILDCVEDLGPAAALDTLKETLKMEKPSEHAMREFLVTADAETQQELYRKLQIELERTRLRAALAPSYTSEPVNEVHFEGFGTIKVVHGDLLPKTLKHSNGYRPDDAKLSDNKDLLDERRFEVPHLLIPMVPNLRPVWGLSLEVFNRGGPDFVTSAVESRRKLVLWNQEQAKLKKADEDADEEHDVLSQDPGEAGDPDVAFGMSFYASGFKVDVVTPDGVKDEPCELPMRLFIMPMYFHGDDSDQKLALRSAIKQALTEGLNNAKTIHLPHVAVGYYGYDPTMSARVLVEEAVDALLQVDVSSGKELWTAERTVVFMDRDRGNVELLSDALEDVKRRYRPEERTQSSTEFWAEKTRQLIVLPDRPYQFLRQDPVKFKKYHGIKRNSRKHYEMNVLNLLWRAHRVRLPRQLLMRKESTAESPEAADNQHPAQPYYFRGISHALFPKSRTTFLGLRASGAGWRGLARQYRLREDTRPRL